MSPCGQTAAAALGSEAVLVTAFNPLGRPRVDVVVSCSGVFRDLFINQMNLLDRAVKMVAELDEPTDQKKRNHIGRATTLLATSVASLATRVRSASSVTAERARMQPGYNIWRR